MYESVGVELSAQAWGVISRRPEIGTVWQSSCTNNIIGSEALGKQHEAKGTAFRSCISGRGFMRLVKGTSRLGNVSPFRHRPLREQALKPGSRNPQKLGISFEATDRRF